MLISPPFLPPRLETQTEEAWLNIAMNPVQGEGIYPVGRNMCWHGGMHLIAPNSTQANQTLPVRAIADGTVIYKREGDAGPSTDTTHVLNYNGWTSNGVVVIQHDTEIGANAQNQATSVRFFSVYMHLTQIPARITTGSAIYRKDILGQAGYIRGTPGRIHFEIACDTANLESLIGRSTGELPVTQDGRSDVVFGELYFYLPSGTPIYGQQPLDNNPVAHIQPPKPSASAPLPPLQALPPISTNAMPCIVGMRFACGEGVVVANRGDLAVRTYLENGTQCGAELREAEYEYKLYTRATEISKAYPANARPAPSAVYELLRFGRIINTANETLTPNDVPHWREIIIPTADGAGTQHGWVNLNNLNAGLEVRKCSDADFPQWKDWRIYNDDISNTDSRCDSDSIKILLDEDGDHHVTPQERTNRMSQQLIQHKLSYAICSMPNEWNTAEIDARWGWLQQSSEENPQALDVENYAGFRNHVTALCFDAPQLQSATYRFHSRRFIEVFRRCGWLSLNETLQLIPQNIIRKPGSHNSVSTGNWESPTLAPARTTLATHRTDLNKALRKFFILSPARQACFFGNSTQETQWFGTLLESNGNTPNLHSGWYGRGFLQLTNPNGNLNNGNNNYYKYFKYTGRQPTTPATPQVITWRDAVGTSSRHSSESATAYWSWDNKSVPSTQNPGLPQVDNANRYADTTSVNQRRTITTAQGTKVWYYNQSFANCAAAVNLPAAVGRNPPNMNGLVDRSTAFVNALMVLGDTNAFATQQGVAQDNPENFSRRRVV